MGGSAGRPRAAKIVILLLAALVSTLIVPLCAWYGGMLVVGPYEGEFGVLGYLGAIFGGAWHGGWLAWTMLLAPVVIIAIWAGLFRLRRGGRAEPPKTPAKAPRQEPHF